MTAAMKKSSKKSMSLHLHIVRNLTEVAAGGDKLVIKPSIQSNCLSMSMCGPGCFP